MVAERSGARGAVGGVPLPPPGGGWGDICERFRGFGWNDPVNNVLFLATTPSHNRARCHLIRVHLSAWAADCGRFALVRFAMSWAKQVPWVSGF